MSLESKNAIEDFEQRLFEEEKDEKEDGDNDDKESLSTAEYYDPDIDRQNEQWMSDKRSAFLPIQNLTGGNESITKSKSDAVLNCPACLSTVCVDCQRHETYKTQFRAMFVLNCVIMHDQLLRYEKKNVSKKRRAKGHGGGKLVDFVHSSGENAGVEVYKPVQCHTCQTQLGVYDMDEVFHFFNVVESIS